MAGMPPIDREEGRSEAPETLAEMLFYLTDPAKRQELEQFRIEYEAVNGLTDLAKRYTSTWPRAHEEWLIKHETKRWFDGLPPFARAYLRGKLEMIARDGRLDDMPDEVIRLYSSGGMRRGPTLGR